MIINVCNVSYYVSSSRENPYNQCFANYNRFECTYIIFQLRIFNIYDVCYIYKKKWTVRNPFSFLTCSRSGAVKTELSSVYYIHVVRGYSVMEAIYAHCRNIYFPLTSIYITKVVFVLSKKKKKKIHPSCALLGFTFCAERNWYIFKRPS